jgi:hypothetical protein
MLWNLSLKGKAPTLRVGALLILCLPLFHGCQVLDLYRSSSADPKGSVSELVPVEGSEASPSLAVPSVVHPEMHRVVGFLVSG